MAATHAGMTTEEFDAIVADWMATAKHPRFKRPYTEIVYQPMLELLAYLRANGFKTFIVSGGGIEFMRAWAEKVYGIPPEQVVGPRRDRSSRWRDGKPVLHEGAEGRIHRRRPGQARRHQPLHRPAADLRLRQLRRRPADAAVDGRRQRRALRAASSTTPTPSASGPTTANRTSASSTRRWTKAEAKGWTVVDMKNDWKKVFSFE